MGIEEPMATGGYAAAAVTAAATKAAAAEVEIERLVGASGMGARTAIDGQVPIIDMSKEGAADAIWEAAQSPGFFTVTNHGIPLELIERTFGRSAKFFDQSKEQKQEQSPFAKDLNAGYEYFSQVRPSTGTADQKESLQITARSGSMDGRWPKEPADFEATAHELMKAAHQLGNRLLDILEPKACPKVATGTLSSAHNLWVHDGQCTLRLLHYPPVKPETLPPNYWRAGPHTDWCALTLLFQLPGNEGLECASNPNAKAPDSAPWLKVDPVVGGISVNIGDMLARWSDHRLLSNLHRVRMPTPEECTPPKSRYSMAFFMQADKHVKIECETMETVTAGDYILGRIRSNFAK